MTFNRDQLPAPAAYFEAQGHKLVGPKSAKWKTTNCNFHGGSDSMRVNIASGGWCCMACNAKGGDILAHHMAEHGVDFVTAAKALGAWQDDGQPARPARPRQLPAASAIEVLQFEVTLTAVAAGNLAHGVHLTDVDRTRLLLAAQRITGILENFT